MSYSIQSHIQVRGLGTPEDTSTSVMDEYTLSMNPVQVYLISL